MGLVPRACYTKIGQSFQNDLLGKFNLTLAHIKKQKKKEEEEEEEEKKKQEKKKKKKKKKTT